MPSAVRGEGGWVAKGASTTTTTPKGKAGGRTTPTRRGATPPSAALARGMASLGMASPDTPGDGARLLPRPRVGARAPPARAARPAWTSVPMEVDDDAPVDDDDDDIEFSPIGVARGSVRPPLKAAPKPAQKAAPKAAPAAPKPAPQASPKPA